MNKKKTNEDKIIEAMDATDKSVRNLKKFGARYDEYIDQAAMRGDDKRAKQLIKQKIGVYALADQLITLKTNIELGAFTSQAVAELANLPDAITACKGILAESPNFAKLGDGIKKVFNDMKKPTAEIAKLNSILDDVLTPPETGLVSRLDDVREDEATDQFKAEYAAMMDRIKAKVATNPINPPVASPVDDSSSLTGNINFDGIISEENKKK